MPRGGRRDGKPGRSYGQRTDLQGASLHSQQYGQGAARQARTAAVPVAAPPQAPSVPGPAAPAPAAPAGPAPGTLGGLMDPSVRPNEPLTHGMPVGPGPGPGLLAQNTTADPDEMALRALYAAHPNPFLRQLIETMEQG